jgi:predicted nucleotidyltransferase
MYTNVVAHANAFADFLESKIPNIHEILRQYESKEVVDDEIHRSIESLRSMQEIRRYFDEVPLTHQTVTFLPLNLPLYSFVLFAAMPSYQSTSLTIRAPQRMQVLFTALFDTLLIKTHYPNINVFEGSRGEFLSTYCKDAAVIIFTGKHENMQRIRKACRADALLLFNGVGHNPLVVTPSADVDLAVEKSLQVKLFNNGQDCAGPDIILVHSSVIDSYLEKLQAKLAPIRCADNYFNDAVVIGPMFEPSSLLGTAKLISDLQEQNGTIQYGGQFDLKNNIMYPCVMRTSLRKTQNFTEIYSPLFVVTEYEDDQELALYFRAAGSQYQQNEMYVSLFGESNYVTGMRGSIILRDCTIHDIERGTEEYGGYSPGGSSVSYRGMTIAKPLLIPREIYNFLSSQGQKMLVSSPGMSRSNGTKQIIEAEFQKAILRIFGNQLVFACIFGSFATGKDKRYSDIDTLVCVKNKYPEQVEEYLRWLFYMHEVFGKIPDFRYPAEIVTFSELQDAIGILPTLELSVKPNEFAKYKTMIWCYCFSQWWTWAGNVQTENVPTQWKQAFPENFSRIFRSFLASLEDAIICGKDVSFLQAAILEVPRKEPELSYFMKNIGDRDLLALLKMIPFEEKPMYSDIVSRLVANREFMGRRIFSVDDQETLYHPDFRFGVIVPPSRKYKRNSMYCSVS